MLDTIIEVSRHVHWQDYLTKFSTILTFLVAALISFLLQSRKHPAQLTLKSLVAFAFPPSGWKSTSSSVDILIYLVSRLFGALFAIGEVAALLWLANAISRLLSYLFIGYQPTTAHYRELIIWSLLVFLAQDFSKFWCHYLDHKVPVLWELHKVHHSATFLSPLTTARRHPLGDKIDAIWWVLLVSAPAGVAKFLFGLSESDILILIANATLISTVLILDALRHSHLPVSFGPLDHSVKVEHWDKNMGDKLFIWDRLFGTGYIPARDEAITYGLGRGAEVDQLYTTAWGVFVTPVVNAVKVLRHGPIERPPALDLLRGGSRTVPTETLAP